MSSANRVTIAAAGSGKTTSLVDQALGKPNRTIAILTYTNNSHDELAKVFAEKHRTVPANVTLFTWYEFILREMARPYQNSLYDRERIERIFFVEGATINYKPRSNVPEYYFAGGCYLYSDRASDFVVRCNEASGGLVVSRLEERFDEIYVDEVQDLSGYDLDVVEMLLRSKLAVSIVGDIRQATYATNHAPKYSQFRGAAIINKFIEWQKQGLLDIKYVEQSHRCVQSICNLADSLYPSLPKTQSLNHVTTGHDGLFVVNSADVKAYCDQYHPEVLRYDAKTLCTVMDPINFGVSKGCTYDRVLIFPNGPLANVLKTGSAQGMKSPAKYYVGLTRARQSVAFVYDKPCALQGLQAFVKIHA